MSFADHIVAAIQDQTNLESATQDTFISSWAESSGKYQFTLGSIQLPSNVMVDSLEQTYFQALSTYNRARDTNSTKSTMAGHLTATRFRDLVAVKTTSFSKDQMLALSQLAISSARSLRLNAELVPAPADNQVVNIYMHYVKVAEVSITDCKINY